MPAPATAEQATPEEMPRPIHLFLRLLAQPIPPVDDAAGPATSSAQLPSAEEPAKSSTSHEATRRCRSDAGGARRAAHVSRRVYPGLFPDAGSIEGPRRLPPVVSPGGAGTRGGIPTKSCGREGVPSRLRRRAQPSSGPTRVGSCSGAGESATRRISASNRFTQCSAAKTA